MSIDFRYVDSKGNSQRGNWAKTPSLFSKKKNQALFDLAKKWGFTNNYRGYNVPIKGGKTASGHNNHGHLSFDIVNKVPRELNYDPRLPHLDRLTWTFFCVVEGCM